MIQNIKKIFNFQAQTNPNRSVVKFLSDLGYPKPKIRKVLMILNGLKYRDFDGLIHQVTLSRVLHTGEGGKKARERFAEKFGLSTAEIFGEE